MHKSAAYIRGYIDGIVKQAARIPKSMYGQDTGLLRAYAAEDNPYLTRLDYQPSMPLRASDNVPQQQYADYTSSLPRRHNAVRVNPIYGSGPEASGVTQVSSASSAFIPRQIQNVANRNPGISQVLQAPEKDMPMPILVHENTHMRDQGAINDWATLPLGLGSDATMREVHKKQTLRRSQALSDVETPAMVAGGTFRLADPSFKPPAGYGRQFDRHADMYGPNYGTPNQRAMATEQLMGYHPSTSPAVRERAKNILSAPPHGSRAFFPATLDRSEQWLDNLRDPSNPLGRGYAAFMRQKGINSYMRRPPVQLPGSGLPAAAQPYYAPNPPINPAPVASNYAPTIQRAQRMQLTQNQPVGAFKSLAVPTTPPQLSANTVPATVKSSAYIRGYIDGIVKQAQNAEMRAVSGNPLSRGYNWLRGTWANRKAIGAADATMNSSLGPESRNPLRNFAQNMITNPGHAPGSSSLGIGQFGGQGKRDQFLGSLSVMPAGGVMRAATLVRGVRPALAGLAGIDTAANAYKAHSAFAANAVRHGVTPGTAYKSLLPVAAGMLPGQRSTPFDSAMRKSIAGNALYAMGGGTEGAIPALHTARMMATGPQQLAGNTLLQRWGDKLRSSGYSALAKTRLPDIRNSAVVNAYRQNPQALGTMARLSLPPQLQAQVSQIQAQLKPVQGKVQQLAHKYGPPYTQQGRMRQIVKNAPPASQGLSYTNMPQFAGNSVPSAVSAQL
jgi:hypothetical protein